MAPVKKQPLGHPVKLPKGRPVIIPATPVITPLTTAMRAMTKDQREEFASLAGTTVNYLYQIAGLHRKNIAVQTAFAIEDASAYMAGQYPSAKLPTVNARQISEMAALAGLQG